MLFLTNCECLGMQLQLSEHFTYPNTLWSQRVRITEVLLYIKNSCNYNIFYVKVTHSFLFIHTKLKLKSYNKALRSIQHTFNFTLVFFKSKPLQCPQ